MNGIPINIRDSGQIKAHIARKGAPAAGGWGIVKLLYELQLRLNNPTVVRVTTFPLTTPPFTQGRQDNDRYRGIILSQNKRIPLRYAAVRGRTALPSATPTNMVEKAVTVSLSGDFRGGFLHFANASVEMTLKSDFLKPSPWGEGGLPKR